MKTAIRTILLAFFLLNASPVLAATWYIRSDGAAYGTTSTTCNGSADVAYTVGNGPNCAVNSIYQIHTWAGGQGTARISGGDEVIFSKSGDSFPIGLNIASVQTGCSTSFPYDCNLDKFPDGTSGNPTLIAGFGYNTTCDASTRVELYGVQGVTRILSTSESDWVEFDCLEVTDHSSCGFRIGPSQCSETYDGDVGDFARNGFQGDGGSNQVYRDLDVHGLSNRAFHVGDVTNLTFVNVNMDGNNHSGFDGDTRPINGLTSPLVDGTISLTNVNVRYNGCGEAYPRSASFSHDDYSGCTDQNASDGPGYGDGFGFYEVDGTFSWIGGSISWNASDGLDLLYQAFDTVNIDKVRFEGNVGNQWKILTTTLNMTNSVTISNCDYLDLTDKIHNTSNFLNCRANGGPVIVPMAGGTYNWFNNTFVSATHSGGSAGIESGATTSTANGTETYTGSNNIFYSPNATWTLYYNGLSGGASTDWLAFSTDHTIIYNFQSNPCPTGTGNQCNTNPDFLGTITASSNNLLDAVRLSSTSPAIGAGVSGNTYWNTSNDFDDNPQNNPVDIGAFIYGEPEPVIPVSVDVSIGRGSRIGTGSSL